MAIAETAARKLLHGARGVAAFSFGLDVLWQLISGFFADILAHIFAALAGLAHLLVLPFEALWHLLLAAVAGAANAVSSGVTGLWHLVAGFFPNLFAALADAAHHLVVLPVEAFWHLLVAAVSGAAGSISSGLHSLWHLVAGFFPNLLAALAGAAHQLLVLPLEALWRWIQSAAAAALSYVLGAAALLLLVALIRYFSPAICAATVRVCRALVYAACYLAHGLYFVGARTVSLLLVLHCGQQQDEDEEAEADSGDVCAVCLAEFRDGETLRLLPRCGHAFHRGCIDTWLRANANCPLCRAPVQVAAAAKSSTAATATRARGEEAERHVIDQSAQ